MEGWGGLTAEGIIWLLGIALFAVAAVGIWYSVTRTDYLPRLAIWLVKQVIREAMKRKSPLLEKRIVQAVREGLEWDFRKDSPKDTR